MHQQKLEESLREGRQVASDLRKYVANLLLELGELAPASSTSGILLALQFIEEVNVKIKAQLETE